jgi:uncharacterized RDD family membrane protein YckC
VPQQPHLPMNQLAATGVASASVAARCDALLADWILCVLAAGLLGTPTRQPWIAPAILIVEYAVFVGLFAQTPGMYLARIRCVALGSGYRLGVPRAALRGLLLCLLVPAVILDADRRGWHDRACGSVVVRVAPAAD